MIVKILGKFRYNWCGWCDISCCFCDLKESDNFVVVLES